MKIALCQTTVHKGLAQESQKCRACDRRGCEGESRHGCSAGDVYLPI